MVATRTALRESLAQVRRHGNFIQRWRWNRIYRRIRRISENPSAAFQIPASRRLGVADLRIFGTADRLGIRTLTTDATFVRVFQNRFNVILDALVYKPLRF